jgi:hypothetical protein
MRHNKRLLILLSLFAFTFNFSLIAAQLTSRPLFPRLFEKMTRDHRRHPEPVAGARISLSFRGVITSNRGEARPYARDAFAEASSELQCPAQVGPQPTPLEGEHSRDEKVRELGLRTFGA